MKGLKIVVSFVVGAACGVAGSWFSAKKHYEKKKNKELADQRKAFHSIMKRQRAGSEKKQTEESTQPIVDQKDIPTKAVIKEEPSYKDYVDLISETGYDGASKEEPYEIEYKTFDETSHKQVYLMWFAEDKVLCNANTGKVYTELHDLLGTDGMELLAEIDADDNQDKFYIRNTVLGLDICVQLEFLQHYEEIFDDGSEE